TRAGRPGCHRGRGAGGPATGTGASGRGTATHAGRGTAAHLPQAPGPTPMTTPVTAPMAADAPTRPRAALSPPRIGWLVVARKEFTDHLRSARFYVLILILGLVGVATTYVAADAIRSAAEAATQVNSIFLRPFLIGSNPFPPFVALIGF